MTAKRFDNKVALITGGSLGLGREIADAFAREGAKVVITGRQAGPLEEAVASLRNTGGDVISVQGDVSRPEDAQKMVRATVERYGRLDILVNNAGINIQLKPLCDLTVEEFDKVIAINLRGSFLCMKYAIPEMIKAGGGAIVNMSSKDGLVSMRSNSAYSSSKSGVIGLTRGAACDYGQQGIRVNAVCPAAHVTAMMEQFRSTFTPEAWEARTREKYPIGRIGRPAEVASAVLFLCSDEASNITGIALPVDGGFTAQ